MGIVHSQNLVQAIVDEAKHLLLRYKNIVKVLELVIAENGVNDPKMVKIEDKGAITITTILLFTPFDALDDGKTLMMDFFNRFFHFYFLN